MYLHSALEVNHPKSPAIRSTVAQKETPIDRGLCIQYPYAALVVVSGGGERVEPVSYNRPQFLDAVEVRSLTVLFLLVIYLVAVNKHLEDSTHTGLHLDGYCTSAFSYKLVDHPGRNTVILSRYAVDDLNVHFSFASHSTYLL